MNKERSLTWKYFWEQKWKESRDFIFSLTAAVVIASWFYLILTAEVDPYNWQAILFVGVSILFAALTIGLIIIISIYWLTDNWETAKERARREIKNSKRGTK